MFEAIPQELKESVEKVLRKASLEAYELLCEVEALVDSVSEQLDEWADALASDAESGGSEKVSPINQYHYIVNHANEYEKKLFGSQKDYLLDNEDVLEGIYASKVAEVGQNGGDFWSHFGDKPV